jgi:hypothetical protein
MRCTFGGARELEDRVDASFPDSLNDCYRLGADGDLALILVTTQLALDGNVGTLRKSGDELGQPAECDTAMPRRAGIPRSGVILPRRFRAAENTAIFVAY